QMLRQFASTVPAHAEFVRLERELITRDADEARVASAIAMGTAMGPIVFRDVSFRYDRSSRAGAGLERVNLTIAPGTFVGVSGPRWARYTLLAVLWVGLLGADSG